MLARLAGRCGRHLWALRWPSVGVRVCGYGGQGATHGLAGMWIWDHRCQGMGSRPRSPFMGPESKAAPAKTSGSPHESPFVLGPKVTIHGIVARAPSMGRKGRSPARQGHHPWDAPQVAIHGMHRVLPQRLAPVCETRVPEAQPGSKVTIRGTGDRSPSMGSGSQPIGRPSRKEPEGRHPWDGGTGGLVWDVRWECKRPAAPERATRPAARCPDLGRQRPSRSWRQRIGDRLWDQSRRLTTIPVRLPLEIGCCVP